MNALTTLIGRAISARSNQTTHLPPGPDRGEDLYAQWKYTFERAQAVSHEAGPSGSGNPRGIDGSGARVAVAAMADELPMPLAQAHSGPQVRTQVPAEAKAGSPAILPMPMTRDCETAVLASLLAVRADPQTNRQALPVRTNATGRAAPAPYSPPRVAADAISVFVRGAAVSIVVRDAHLSELEGLRCGFETARRLTGLPSSLTTLTINGREAYRRPDHSAPTGPAALFTC